MTFLNTLSDALVTFVLNCFADLSCILVDFNAAILFEL